MHRVAVFSIIFVVISSYCCVCHSILAGVYPNYHASYEFASLDKDHNEQRIAERVASLKWWQTASFYQIYPRSFKDSDGDGVGDLNGITESLPYLKEIGIAAAWISPIFTSPMADFGYDIANFTEIDPIFGTMADFERMIAKSKQLGVKIILDFVPNHTSDECEWFKRSAASDPEYKDFYVWHPGKIVNGQHEPPTNWVSVFRGSAWTWHEGRKAYYLHQFLNKQPDLNYRNPKVREAMKNVLLFWLAKGVAGFRIDAPKHLLEIAPDDAGNWPDEPRNNAVVDPDDYGYLEHIYTVDQPDTPHLVYEWRAVLQKEQREHGGDERILMAETASPIDIMMQYYGNATAEGAQIPFNFLLIGLSNGTNAYGYVDTVNTWLMHMPAGRTANWVLGNHDQNRIGSRLGADRMDMMNMLTFTLPGCSVTYMGEEIGMVDVWISWNDTVDPAACNSNPNIYERFSRDPERTPFQWSSAIDAGFSSATKTWLPIAPDYKQVNVELERKTNLSHLNIFKSLIEVRKTPTLMLGETEIKALDDSIIGVKRSLLNEHTFLMLMNINDTTEMIDLNAFFKNLPEELEYVIVTEKSLAKLGHRTKSNALQLMPKEAVVLRSPQKLTTTFGYFSYYRSAASSPYLNSLLCLALVMAAFQISA